MIALLLVGLLAPTMMLALLYPEMAAGGDLVTPELLAMLRAVAFPDPASAHDAFLASLQCTPEMIAEQQAALEAEAGG